jgi:hypothetical protein
MSYEKIKKSGNEWEMIWFGTKKNGQTARFLMFGMRTENRS